MNCLRNRALLDCPVSGVNGYGPNKVLSLITLLKAPRIAAVTVFHGLKRWQAYYPWQSLSKLQDPERDFSHIHSLIFHLL